MSEKEIKTEELTKTANNLIFVEHDTPKSRAQMDEIMEKLRDICKNYDPIDSEEIKKVLHEMVPTYHNPEEVNKTAENTQEMQLSKK